MDKKRYNIKRNNDSDTNNKNNQKITNDLPKLSQLRHKNRIKSITYKGYNETIPFMTYESNTEANSHYNNENNNKVNVQKTINKKMFLMPMRNNYGLKHRKIKSNLTQSSQNSKNKGDAYNKNQIISFTNTINQIRNNSVENQHNRIYVHKKLKNFNQNLKNKISMNDNNDISCQNNVSNNGNKNYYSKLIVFPNKANYFRKKTLGVIENINKDKSGTIKNINSFNGVSSTNKSPLFKKKKTIFKFPNNENIGSNFDSEDDENENENINSNKLDDDVDYNLPDDIEHRLDNLDDYINIYSIKDSLDLNEKNKSINNEDNDNDNENENDNDNDNEENEDKIVIKKNNNKKNSNSNNNIIINTNKINNIKNRINNNEEKNTININKNIIINKKIILIPEEQNSNKKQCSKTSYGFFNTYKKTYKNIINIPYSNNFFKQNTTNTSRNELLNHCQTKDSLNSLNNYIYKKKNFASPTPKIKKYISFFTEESNKGTKNIIDLIDNQTLETYQMSHTINKFYEPKKLNKFNTNHDLSNQTFDNNHNFRENSVMSDIISNNIKKRLANGRLKDDIYYKLNCSEKKDLEKNNKFIIIDIPKENKKEEEEKEKYDSDFITNLSLLEISKFLEMKLKIILNKIAKYQNCEKECYEFIHFYFDHNFNHHKIDIFINKMNKELITNYTKMEIIYFFLCYDILSSKKFNKACIILKSIVTLLYDNLIALLFLIIKYYKDDNKEIINSLNTIVTEYVRKNRDIKNANMNENKVIQIIGNNTNDIIIYYKMLIESLYKKYYNEKDYSVKFPECIKNLDNGKNDTNKTKNVIYSFFNEAYTNTKNYDFLEFKYFFYLFLSNKNEKVPIKQRYSKSRKIKSIKTKEKHKEKPKYKKNENENEKLDIIPMSNNYIIRPIKNNYKYTLILGLDETLIYNNIDNYVSFKKDRTIHLRPNIHEFLREMKKIYELIIFSEKSKDYVDPIIDLIQKKEKYFSYVLCEQYVTLDSNGQEMKDINLLGRNLKNVIIVDNKDLYYKLFKDNFIYIEPFNGENKKNKKNILKIYEKALKEIQLDAEKTKDIRISIDKFRYKLDPNNINNLD